MDTVIDLLEPLRRFGVRLGPYVLLELLLPGGTLFALLLFLHQHLKAGAGALAARPASPVVLVTALHAARSIESAGVTWRRSPAGSEPAHPAQAGGSRCRKISIVRRKMKPKTPSAHASATA